MTSETVAGSALTQKAFIEGLIRVGLVAILAFYCLKVFAPFLAIMLWGMILAIMLYPLHQRVAKWFGGKQGRAAIAIVVVAYLLMGVPITLLGNSFVKHLHAFRTAHQNNELTIKQPDPKVAEWPIIGKRVYKAWNVAATNLPIFLADYKDELKAFSKNILSGTKNAVGAVSLFLGALIIAGIMMTWGQQGTRTMLRILIRLAGPVKGPELHGLSVATTRSVATGVLGVAFIQALLIGIGFVLAGVPAPGLLALVVMFLGIIQLPAAIVALPVVIYLWTGGDASLIANIFYTVYFIFAGMSDNVLKPLLLGRGVDAPMPVILIGALGGMVAGGLIGLFLGAILLAIGYKVFMGWVDDVEDSTIADAVET